jgi:hypothetical protein
MSFPVMVRCEAFVKEASDPTWELSSEIESDPLEARNSPVTDTPLKVRWLSPASWMDENVAPSGFWDVRVTLLAKDFSRQVERAIVARVEHDGLARYRGVEGRFKLRCI